MKNQRSDPERDISIEEGKRTGISKIITHSNGNP